MAEHLNSRADGVGSPSVEGLNVAMGFMMDAAHEVQRRIARLSAATQVQVEAEPIAKRRRLDAIACSDEPYQGVAYKLAQKLSQNTCGNNCTRTCVCKSTERKEVIKAVLLLLRLGVVENTDFLDLPRFLPDVLQLIECDKLVGDELLSDLFKVLSCLGKDVVPKHVSLLTSSSKRVRALAAASLAKDSIEAAVSEFAMASCSPNKCGHDALCALAALGELAAPAAPLLHKLLEDIAYERFEWRTTGGEPAVNKRERVRHIVDTINAFHSDMKVGCRSSFSTEFNAAALFNVLHSKKEYNAAALAPAIPSLAKMLELRGDLQVEAAAIFNELGQGAAPAVQQLQECVIRIASDDVEPAECKCEVVQHAISTLEQVGEVALAPAIPSLGMMLLLSGELQEKAATILNRLGKAAAPVVQNLQGCLKNIAASDSLSVERTKTLVSNVARTLEQLGKASMDPVVLSLGHLLSKEEPIAVESAAALGRFGNAGAATRPALSQLHEALRKASRSKCDQLIINITNVLKSLDTEAVMPAIAELEALLQAQCCSAAVAFNILGKRAASALPSLLRTAEEMVSARKYDKFLLNLIQTIHKIDDAALGQLVVTISRNGLRSCGPGISPLELLKHCGNSCSAIAMQLGQELEKYKRRDVSSISPALIEVFANCGEAAGGAVPMISRCLFAKGCPALRLAAVKAISGIGSPHAAAALPDLEQALMDSNADVKNAALSAIASFREARDREVSRLGA